MPKLRSLFFFEKKSFVPFVFKGWQILSGLLFIFFASKYLDSEHLGIYYVFFSIISLQALIDLGFVNSIITFVSHEMSSIKVDKMAIRGDENAMGNLKNIFQHTVKWYGLGVGVLWLIYFCIGYFMFVSKSLSSEIFPLWILYSTIACVNLFSSFIGAFFEGMNLLFKVYSFRLWQSLLSNILFFILMPIMGLKSIVFQISLSTTILFIFLWFNRKILINIYYTIQDGNSFLLKEFKRHQFRLGISWVFGYFIFNAYTPLIFRICGAADAGKFGMTLQIMSAITSIVFTFFSIKAPTIGKLISSKNFKSALSMFNQSLIHSLSLQFFIITCFITLFTYSNLFSKYVDRVLPIPFFVSMLIATFFLNITYIQAAFLRLFKKEPYLKQTILVSVTSLVSMYFFLIKYGVNGAVYAYLASVVCIGFVYSLIIFFRFKVNEETSIINLYSNL